ncbi:hypothetical protein M9H77_02446 [Catharanthus roseus]|uniref:Uncharacterized protein n=1 Tax=Catharanthus roseus TaxID=4058 RepID=A0ACC0C8J4_CATRO|nr:hypothetical protein M9H77_02446 [Catharanthus roseus]
MGTIWNFIAAILIEACIFIDEFSGWRAKRQTIGLSSLVHMMKLPCNEKRHHSATVSLVEIRGVVSDFLAFSNVNGFSLVKKSIYVADRPFDLFPSKDSRCYRCSCLEVWNRPYLRRFGSTNENDGCTAVPCIDNSLSFGLKAFLKQSIGLCSCIRTGPVPNPLASVCGTKVCAKQEVPELIGDGTARVSYFSSIHLTHQAFKRKVQFSKWYKEWYMKWWIQFESQATHQGSST